MRYYLGSGGRLESGKEMVAMAVLTFEMVISFALLFSASVAGFAVAVRDGEESGEYFKVNGGGWLGGYM